MEVFSEESELVVSVEGDLCQDLFSFVAILVQLALLDSGHVVVSRRSITVRQSTGRLGISGNHRWTTIDSSSRLVLEQGDAQGSEQHYGHQHQHHGQPI